MNLQETMNTQYILGRLSISVPTTSARLKTETQDLEHRRGAQTGTLGVSVKNIYQHSNLLLSPMQTLRTVRTYVNERTVPWTAKTEHTKRAAGPRLIHVDQAASIDRYISDTRRVYEDALSAITVSAYENELRILRHQFGDVADQITWPSYYEFKCKHNLSFELEPFPAFSPKMAKTGLLPAEFVSKFSADYEARERKLVKFAFEERKTRLIEALENLYTVLSTDAKLFVTTWEKPLILLQGGISSLARVLGIDSQYIEGTISTIRETIEYEIEYARANRKMIAIKIAELIEGVKTW